jgi:hypothetical protein
MLRPETHKKSNFGVVHSGWRSLAIGSQNVII